MNEKEKIIIQAIEFMKKHLNEEITSESLAHHVGYSPFHFSRVFKEVTGVSPRHYLSALRIEVGKQILVNPSNSIVKTLLEVGFQSIGTFSSRFKKFVGLSPKAYQKNMESLHSFVNEYDFPKELHSLDPLAPSVTCHVIPPPSFKGIIFVGLFPRPIPDEAPIVGYALNHHRTSCTFQEVPKGEYYVLAVAVTKSLNPKHYVLLDKALRGKSKETIKLDENTTGYVEVHLREPLPFDPPILINLPKLLFDKEKRKQEEK